MMLHQNVVRRGATLCLLLQMACLVKANATADFGTAAVLPKGRFQAVLRVGNVSDIQNKYNNGGILETPSRFNQRFDNKFLKKFSPEFRKFADMINKQNPDLHPADEIDAGALGFQGKADVSYFAPQLAYGISPQWTIGMAIPVVNFKSDVHMVNVGVNTAPAVLRTIADEKHIADLNEEAGQGAKLVSSGPSGMTASTLAKSEYGYKPISNRNEQFLGDIVVGSVVRLKDTKYWDLFLMNTLTLPTGPQDDPDDLVDIPIFGKTALQNTLYNNFDVNYWLKLGVGVYYTWGIPDHIAKRVPTSEDDFIPKLDTKETLSRDPGDEVGIQFASEFKISDYFGLGAGLDFARKGKDKYSGIRDSRYDLLEKNTNEEYTLVKFKAVYTTVDAFLNGQSNIPYSITYAFSDTVRGVNVERELTHELLLKFYF